MELKKATQIAVRTALYFKDFHGCGPADFKLVVITGALPTDHQRAACKLMIELGYFDHLLEWVWTFHK